MKTFTKLLVLAVIVGFAAMAEAKGGKGKGAPADKPLQGSVVKVDGTNLTIKTGQGELAKEQTIATNDQTQIIIKGVAGKLSDLQVDQKVLVQQVAGTATKIEVPDAAAGKGGKGGKGKGGRK